MFGTWLFFHILGIISKTDFYFSEGSGYHQPAVYRNCRNGCQNESGKSANSPWKIYRAGLRYLAARESSRGLEDPATGHHVRMGSQNHCPHILGNKHLLLVFWNMTGLFMIIFHFIYGIINPSHWRTHIFQDGYCTTNQPCFFLARSPRSAMYINIIGILLMTWWHWFYLSALSHIHIPGISGLVSFCLLVNTMGAYTTKGSCENSDLNIDMDVYT